MRDARRISRILGLLEHYWRVHPDLRLAQIVGNAAPHRDTYHFEDADLEAWLQQEIEDGALLSAGDKP